MLTKLLIDLDTNAWLVADTALMFLSLLFFTLSSIKDPGYLHKPTKVSFLVSIPQTLMSSLSNSN